MDRWIFRVASASRHGGGHVSRCLTLAEAMGNEASISFRIDPGAAKAEDRIRARGFSAAEDGGRPEANGTACVLDGYDFDADTVARCAASGPLAYLHDFGAVPSAAALVVNGGFQMTGASLKGVPALLGPAYALTGPDFRPAGRRTDRVETVLISMGRMDATKATCLALEALILARVDGFTPSIHVALGSECLHLDQVRQMLDGFNADAVLHVDTTTMADLMARADLIIGAGGVGLQERVAMGIPSITLVVAENQTESTEAATAAGLTALGLRHGAVTPVQLKHEILRLAASQEARRTMAENGPATIDGKGPARVAAALKILRHTAL